MSKNLLKIWYKLIEVDRQYHNKRETIHPLEDWIVAVAPERLGRKISKETVMFMKREELLKLLNYGDQWGWVKALTKVIECEND